MRGGFPAFLLSVLFFTACSGPPAAPPPAPVAEPERPVPAPTPPSEPEPKPIPKVPSSRVPDPVPLIEPGGGRPSKPTASAVPVVADAPIFADPVIHPALQVQIERTKEKPTDEERLRLAILHAIEGDLEAAEEAFSKMQNREGRLARAFGYFLLRELGDHPGAAALMEEFRKERRAAEGLAIGRAVLCSSVRRFRHYVPAENDTVRPGGYALIYVEPRNFTLRESGGRSILHLKYDWELLDDRSRKQSVPAWERAPESDREDRISYEGPVEEFYQSFRLPLPRNLAMGHYRIRVIVTDAHTGAEDRVSVPIYVRAAESTP